ncbi:DegT/DnrJ/EryC1/StrS family aminotransferase [Oligoflexus tunisiensis]|uniref:DegT/DnrJ/EryC1/StrS family aminotransferase n=1 Tax=Oligoflexus tunisiensis TaxID=708132 RepID=UPI000AD45C61|nr:DegT/DnrJ/EryC1/StrS family aminotransferase [Oligoflexus tunisiensis]
MIPLHEPYFDDADEALVLEALRSTWVSTGGPFVDRFEKEIAAFTGARFAVSTTNGTTAIQLMLYTLKRLKELQRFDRFEVLVPTLTFIATANAVVHAGGDPIFLDASPHSFNIHPGEVERFLKENYRFDDKRQLWISRISGFPLLAYLPVHVMGWAPWQDELKAFSLNNKLAVVEDAAEALGTFSLTGNHAGRSGIASALSFNGNKILTTGGGGMILTDDHEFAKLAKHLSTTAKTDGLNYVHDEVGFNFRLVNVLAAMGCSQLSRMSENLKKKQRIYESYQECLKGVESRVLVYSESGCKQNNWLVNIVFDDKNDKANCLKSLLASKMGARPLWTPLHLQPAFRAPGIEIRSFPHAESIWERTISLPSSPNLSLEVIADVSAAVVKGLS